MLDELNIKYLPSATENGDMPDFNKTPSAIKKAEKARALIAKYGLPKSKKPGKSK